MMRLLKPGQMLRVKKEIHVDADLQPDDVIAVVLMVGAKVKYIKPVKLRCELSDGTLVDLNTDVLDFEVQE